ncbi:hypothetical protein ACRQ5D_10840 [Mucilaginibacter sp. P25]|uniref:hypothetical protein n=1 Tax=Mucilaginibacter sp. P25 TaxID=3423945 RepID=UPI003D7AB95A
MKDSKHRWMLRPSDRIVTEDILKEKRAINPRDYEIEILNYPPPPLTLEHVKDVVNEYKATTNKHPRFIFINKGFYLSLQKQYPGGITHLFLPSIIAGLNDMPFDRIIATHDDLRSY